jgi:hypothetical protein
LKAYIVLILEFITCKWIQIFTLINNNNNNNNNNNKNQNSTSPSKLGTEMVCVAKNW